MTEVTSCGLQVRPRIATVLLSFLENHNHSSGNMVSNLFLGSNCINTECVLSKFKLEEFNCLRKPPEDYKTEGYFSRSLVS